MTQSMRVYNKGYFCSISTAWFFGNASITPSNILGIYFDWYSLGLVLFSLVQNDLSVFNMRVCSYHLKIDHPSRREHGQWWTTFSNICCVGATAQWYLPRKSWQCSQHVPNSRFDLQHRNKYMLRSRTIILCKIFLKVSDIRNKQNKMCTKM